MQKFFIVAGVAMLIAIPASAFAGTKSEDSAVFRVKVATCKATAKTDGVKTSSAEFYGYMQACIGKVTVNVAVAAK